MYVLMREREMEEKEREREKGPWPCCITQQCVLCVNVFLCIYIPSSLKSAPGPGFDVSGERANKHLFPHSALRLLQAQPGHSTSKQRLPKSRHKCP